MVLFSPQTILEPESWGVAVGQLGQNTCCADVTGVVCAGCVIHPGHDTVRVSKCAADGVLRAQGIKRVLTV